MATHFDDFTLATNINPTDYLVGYSIPSVGGEKRWSYATLIGNYANAAAKAFGSTRWGPVGVSGQNGTTQTLTNSSFFGVASVTWESRGYYKVTFSNPMPDANYAAIAQNAPAHNPAFTDENGNGEWHDYSSPGYYQNGNENSLFIMNKTTSSFYILCWSHESNVKENTNGFAFAVFDN